MSVITFPRFLILLIVLILFTPNKSWAETHADLVAMLEQSQAKSNWQKIKFINRWVNQAASQSTDLKIWQQEDYWASPLELLEKTAADCEDYAITKYLLLKEAGINEARLYLSHVELEGQVEPHMVLVYSNSDDQGFYILDNVKAQVKPADLRPDLDFKYSFNEHGLYLGSPSGFTVIPDASPTQLHKWQDVLNKWQLEKTQIKLNN